MEKTKRQLQAAKNRVHIYESTIRLFNKKPYNKITIDDICVEAGISVGIFYYYFKNKEAILKESFNVLDSNFVSSAMFAENLSPVMKIAYYSKLYNQIVERRGYLFMSVILGHELTNIIPHKTNAKRKIYGILYSTIKDGVDSGAIDYASADEFYSDLFRILRGTSYDWVLARGGFNIEDEFFSLFLRTFKGCFKPKIDMSDIKKLKIQKPSDKI